MNQGTFHVITHNGKPVADGGRRIGYAVDGTSVTSIAGYQPFDDFLANWNRAQVPAPSGARLAAVVETPTLQSIFDLQYLSMGRYCTGCDEYTSSSLVRRMEFREGERSVTACRHCGKIHRA